MYFCSHNEQLYKDKYMKTNVQPAEGKLGILVVGCGAVATTLMTGVLMTRKGLAKPIGSMTQYDKMRVGKGAAKQYLSYADIVPIASLADLVFGCWMSIRRTPIRVPSMQKC